jgi:hypothetical protein
MSDPPPDMSGVIKAALGKGYVVLSRKQFDRFIIESFEPEQQGPMESRLLGLNRSPRRGSVVMLSLNKKAHDYREKILNFFVSPEELLDSPSESEEGEEMKTSSEDVTRMDVDDFIEFPKGKFWETEDYGKYKTRSAFSRYVIATLRKLRINYPNAIWVFNPGADVVQGAHSLISGVIEVSDEDFRRNMTSRIMGRLPKVIPNKLLGGKRFFPDAVMTLREKAAVVKYVWLPLMFWVDGSSPEDGGLKPGESMHARKYGGTKEWSAGEHTEGDPDFIRAAESPDYVVLKNTESLLEHFHKNIMRLADEEEPKPTNPEESILAMRGYMEQAGQYSIPVYKGFSAITKPGIYISPSGAGKTTFVNESVSEIDPDGGRAAGSVTVKTGGGIEKRKILSGKGQTSVEAMDEHLTKYEDDPEVTVLETGGKSSKAGGRKTTIMTTLTPDGLKKLDSLLTSNVVVAVVHPDDRTYNINMKSRGYKEDDMTGKEAGLKLAKTLASFDQKKRRYVLSRDFNSDLLSRGVLKDDSDYGSPHQVRDAIDNIRINLRPVKADDDQSIPDDGTLDVTAKERDRLIASGYPVYLGEEDPIMLGREIHALFTGRKNVVVIPNDKMPKFGNRVIKSVTVHPRRGEELHVSIIRKDRHVLGWMDRTFGFGTVKALDDISSGVTSGIPTDRSLPISSLPSHASRAEGMKIADMVQSLDGIPIATVVVASKGSGIESSLDPDAHDEARYEIKLDHDRRGRIVRTIVGKENLAKLLEEVNLSMEYNVVNVELKDVTSRKQATITVTALVVDETSGMRMPDPVWLSTHGKNTIAHTLSVPRDTKKQAIIGEFYDWLRSDLGVVVPTDTRQFMEWKGKLNVEIILERRERMNASQVSDVRQASADLSTRVEECGVGLNGAVTGLVMISELLQMRMSPRPIFSVADGRDVSPMKVSDGEAIMQFASRAEASEGLMTPFSCWGSEWDEDRRGVIGYTTRTSHDWPIISLDLLIRAFGVQEADRTDIEQGGDYLVHLLNRMSGPILVNAEQEGMIKKMGVKKVTRWDDLAKYWNIVDLPNAFEFLGTHDASSGKMIDYNVITEFIANHQEVARYHGAVLPAESFSHINLEGSST